MYSPTWKFYFQFGTFYLLLGNFIYQVNKIPLQFYLLGQENDFCLLFLYENVIFENVSLHSFSYIQIFVILYISNIKIKRKKHFFF